MPRTAAVHRGGETQCLDRTTPNFGAGGTCVPESRPELGMSLRAHWGSSGSSPSWTTQAGGGLPESSRCCRAPAHGRPYQLRRRLEAGDYTFCGSGSEASAAHSAGAGPRTPNASRARPRFENSSPAPVPPGTGASSLERPSSARAYSSKPEASPFKH